MIEKKEDHQIIINPDKMKKSDYRFIFEAQKLTKELKKSQKDLKYTTKIITRLIKVIIMLMDYPNLLEFEKKTKIRINHLYRFGVKNIKN